MENKFSSWTHWSKIKNLTGTDCPGIYAIARKPKNIKDGQKFKFSPEILYIGVTTRENGLKRRLYEFENTILGKDGHGGAHHFRKQILDNPARGFKNMDDFFVAIYPVPCNFKGSKGDFYRKKAKIVSLEYLAWAHFHDKFGRYPRFNDAAANKEYYY